MLNPSISRRDMLRTAAGAAGAVVFAPMINLNRYQLFASSPREYSERAIRLVTGSLVIDMLSPLTINNDMAERWGTDAENFTQADYERFRSSGIDVFHTAVGVGSRDSALAFIAYYNSLMAGRDEYFMRIDSGADFQRAKDAAKIGVLIGLQNSSHFENADDVDYFHSIGQRVSQLTYNSRNRIGNGSTERVDGGISDFGVRIIERMNEVGMAVDVSHSGDQTTLDATELSKQPVFFTHSNARALTPGHPRCKTDEAIRAMAATGGVMGITGVRMFVKNDEPTTIEHMIDHYDYVRDLVGIEHLGIGSDVDLDGYDDLPPKQNEALRGSYKGSYGFREKIDIEGVDHPQRMFDVTEALIRRGYSDDNIQAVLGGNFGRVLGQVWDVPPRQKEEPTAA